MCLLVWLSSCGYGPGASHTYGLSASVSGLQSPGLTLEVNGSIVPVAEGTTSIGLASGLSSGSSYQVTVATQPSQNVCSLTGGSGTISSANVSSIVVTCSDQSFQLGGSISGLNGSGLILANGADTLSVASGATSFAMPAPVAYGSGYDLTVQTQPPGLSCAVTHGMGTMPANNLNTVAVTCSDQPYTIGGSITGLGSSAGLVLINGADMLSVAAGAVSFTMPAAAPFGSSYAVQVKSSPAGLTCSVAHGTGVVGAGNVSNVTITCAAQAFRITGSIGGLTATGLVLANGSDTLQVPSGATSFAMPTPVATGSAFLVGVLANPTGETCTIANGSGFIGASDITNVMVTCSTVTVTIGGTISGLGAHSGLTLLNNGVDVTPISANATGFAMHTGVAYGSSYDITVGTQPYGISLDCQVVGGTGSANGDITSISVTCSAVTAVVQSLIAGWFRYPVGVAVDTNDNVFVADGSEVREFLFSNGSYSAQPIMIASGLSEPQGVSLDSGGNLFIADSADHQILKYALSNGSYGGTALTVASGLSFPVGVQADTNGNVFFTDAYAHSVSEILYSNGQYATSALPLGSGFNTPTGLALDTHGDVFVADNNDSSIQEIVNNHGTYGSATINIGSGFNVPTGVAFDISGNLFVADTHNNAVDEVLNDNGAFAGASIGLGSGFHNPQGVTVDANGNVFVADSQSSQVKEITYLNGSYGTTPTALSALGRPVAAAVDSDGNVFLADSSSGNIYELAYANGLYATAPVTVAFGLGNIVGIALDARGHLFVAESYPGAVEEITLGNPTPLPLAPGNFLSPVGLAVDAQGNVFVADQGSNTLEEIIFSGGTYLPVPTTIANSLYGMSAGPAIDSNGDLFVGFGNNAPQSSVQEFVYSNGSYAGTPVVITTNANQPTSIAIDSSGNIFVMDYIVEEFTLDNGTYNPSPATVGSNFYNPRFLTLDSQDRLYVGDLLNLQILLP